MNGTLTLFDGGQLVGYVSIKDVTHVLAVSTPDAVARTRGGA